MASIIVRTDGTKEETTVTEARTGRDLTPYLDRIDFTGVKVTIEMRAALDIQVESVSIVPTGRLKEARINALNKVELDELTPADLPVLQFRLEELTTIIQGITDNESGGEDLSDDDAEYLQIYQGYRTKVAILQERRLAHAIPDTGNGGSGDGSGADSGT